MARMEEVLALWLAQKLCSAEGNASREIFVSDIVERVEEGASLEQAMAAVTRHDPKAGDFGMEVVGSLATVAVLEGLKTFWSAYLRELEEKAGRSLADMTVDFIKSKYKADAATATSDMEVKVGDSIVAAGARLKVKSEKLKGIIDSVPVAINSSLL